MYYQNYIIKIILSKLYYQNTYLGLGLPLDCIPWSQIFFLFSTFNLSLILSDRQWTLNGLYIERNVLCSVCTGLKPGGIKKSITATIVFYVILHHPVSPSQNCYKLKLPIRKLHTDQGREREEIKNTR